MRVVNRERPPNYDQVVEVFPHAADDGVMFCWLDKIYVPRPVGSIPVQLMAHEEVHSKRQKIVGIEAWWSSYLSSKDFRLHEETLAHRQELEVHILMNRKKWVSQTGMRRYFTNHVARRLASPLYGPMISVEDAVKALAT